MKRSGMRIMVKCLQSRARQADRYISFRFDDGFITGARKAARLLSPDKASFFLITSLLSDHSALKDLEYLNGPDFGSIEEWSAFSRDGHDIQPHGHRHISFAVSSEADQANDLSLSLAIIKQIHSGPNVFCFPYNAVSPLELPRFGIDAAGFASVPSDSPVQFNRLDETLDLFALKSWAVRERHLETVVDQLANQTPAGSWTIVAFHSLDGEGYEPWSSDAFARLVKGVRDSGFQIRTIGGTVEQLISVRQQDRCLRQA